MLNTININLKTDIKTDRPTTLPIKLMSQDKNNNQFILRFTNGGESVTLDDNYTVEVLTKFTKSGTSRLTTAKVRQNYATWEFDTAYITQDEAVYNYVYVRKSGNLVVSADANCFVFSVDLSEIDKGAGKVAETYDENYQKYLDEFKDNVDFEEIAQAEQARREAELLREESYEQKVDTAIVESDVVEKVDNKVTELTPKINELTAQLAQKAEQENLHQTNMEVEGTNRRIDNIVIPLSPENANIEVTDSHVSVVKNKTFPSLPKRLEETEREFMEFSKGSPIVNVLKNANFSDTSNWISTNANISANNNALEINRRVPGIPLEMYQIVKTIPYHWYYLAGFVKTTSDDVFLTVNGSSTYRAYHSGSGEYERLTTNYLVGDVTERIFQVYDPRVEGEIDSIFLKNMLFVDLTKTFGVGNEPTKEEMDVFMNEYFEDGWFNGAASLGGYLKYMQDSIIKEIPEISDFIVPILDSDPPNPTDGQMWISTGTTTNPVVKSIDSVVIE